jgi:hypothetical protein
MLCLDDIEIKGKRSGSQEIGERGHTISSGRVPSSGAKTCSLLLCKSASANRVPSSSANLCPSLCKSCALLLCKSCALLLLPSSKSVLQIVTRVLQILLRASDNGQTVVWTVVCVDCGGRTVVAWTVVCAHGLWSDNGCGLCVLPLQQAARF